MPSYVATYVLELPFVNRLVDFQNLLPGILETPCQAFGLPKPASVLGTFPEQ